MDKALVVFSGGQDSTTCLFWAIKNFKEVEAITFFYGQKHKVELECAEDICKELGIKQTVIDLAFFGAFTDSALTNGSKLVTDVEPNGLPATFVPNRNALFFTITHAYAQKIGATTVVTGACETDYSGYPDCRREFINSLQGTLNYGSQVNIRIETPLMYLTKAQTFKLAEDIGGLNFVIKKSHTCYRGDRTILNEWGYGCGTCPACELRKKGYYEFRKVC